jgi:hypothetical protein
MRINVGDGADITIISHCAPRRKVDLLSLYFRIVFMEIIKHRGYTKTDFEPQGYAITNFEPQSH